MGKTLNQQKSGLSLEEKHSPAGGCMWGLLHHLQHNRWNQAKKRLTTRKPHDKKSRILDDHEESNTTTTTCDAQETHVNSSKSSSRKARLKSLITEEMYKGKFDRHQRTTTSLSPTKPAPLDDHTNNNHDDDDSSCELCTTMRKSNYLKQIEVTEPVSDHTLFRDKLVYAIEHTNKHEDSSSLQESKLFINALDLLNLRKEVFLKVLHDPTSSLHRRLNKSVSFPASGPSARTHNDDDADHSNNNNNKQQHLVLDDKGSTDSFVVVKRFKNLREKIKHVISDKKKDKYRILMDSVQHIIPYGQHSRPKEDCNNNNKKKLHKRTSSFDESCGRKYNQLLDGKEAKDHRHNINRLRSSTGDNNIIIPRRFERILSLPNLRPCSEDSFKASSSSSLQAEPAEDKPRDVAPCVLESASQENLIELAGSTFDESSDSKAWETAASHDLNLEVVPSSDPRLLDSENEFYCDQEHDEPEPMPVSQDEKFHNENDSSSGQHDPTSTMKNEAEFCYVRDMLELAGFTRDELLGKWHSTGHPMDPMLFDEVEGDFLIGNEDMSTSCDHLLLFDLINEVLLDIHERSFYYWPAPLTSRSRMHRMPTGYRVLEEVWGEIGCLLSWRPELDKSIDDSVRRDLGKGDRWMSIQMDAEFVGLELEDLIFDDLLQEIVSTLSRDS